MFFNLNLPIDTSEIFISGSNITIAVPRLSISQIISWKICIFLEYVFAFIFSIFVHHLKLHVYKRSNVCIFFFFFKFSALFSAVCLPLGIPGICILVLGRNERTPVLWYHIYTSSPISAFIINIFLFCIQTLLGRRREYLLISNYPIILIFSKVFSFAFSRILDITCHILYRHIECHVMCQFMINNL